METDTRYLKLS